ncbi:MAG: hypothetical protein LV480_11635 [Methylacidiphilales bacterium]|nr:hypothetical protein [Candidatus Methylacidiphilales bacterium]
MKTPFKFFVVALILSFSFAPSPVRAQDEPPPPPPDQSQDDQGDQGASFQNFYDQLSSQGNWVQTDDYGYVFQPNVSDPNWAPYTDGHWVYTDAGWAWVSDEPWGWATYHYGRWVNIDGFGWAWVPGYRWAPAWVSWRYGGGYCGWAPLPPETLVGAEYGAPGFSLWATFHFGSDVDTSFNIGPGCYNFVRVGDMGYPNYHGRYINRSNNYVIINHTTNVTNININRYGANGGTANFRGVAVGGPPINEINAHSQQRVPTVRFTAMNQPGESRLQGNSLAVYAPAINPATLHQGRPATVSQTIAHPTFNRGDSITKPLDVTANVRPPAPTSEAIQAAQTAEMHAPASARIATAKTTVRTPLNEPLTSLQPVAQVHHSATTVNPNTVHATANSPYTGEPVKPETTYHPQTQSSSSPTYHPYNTPPATTYHPQNEVKPAETYHPQSQSSGGQLYHSYNPPPQTTYHPQTEVKPTETYHPQTQSSGGQNYHPQAEVKPAAPVHTQAPPPNKPAGNENKKPADDKNKQQGQ